MRKKLICIVLICFIVLLPSCSDSNVSLAGRKYVYAPYTVKDSNNKYLFWIYKFISNSDVQKEVRSGSSTGTLFTEITVCKYTLTYPKMSIEDGGTYTFTFSNENSFKNDFVNTEYVWEK